MTYAMEGLASGELFSYRGRVLVHGNRHEIEWVMAIPTFKIVELPGDTPQECEERYGRPFMRLQDMPGMSHLTWPLDKREFRS